VYECSGSVTSDIEKHLLTYIPYLCYRSRARYLEYLGTIHWYSSRRVHDSHAGEVRAEITHVQLVLNLRLEWSRDPTTAQRHPVQPL